MRSSVNRGAATGLDRSRLPARKTGTHTAFPQPSQGQRLGVEGSSVTPSKGRPGSARPVESCTQRVRQPT